MYLNRKWPQYVFIKFESAYLFRSFLLFAFSLHSFDTHAMSSFVGINYLQQEPISVSILGWFSYVMFHLYAQITIQRFLLDTFSHINQYQKQMLCEIFYPTKGKKPLPRLWVAELHRQPQIHSIYICWHLNDT